MSSDPSPPGKPGARILSFRRGQPRPRPLSPDAPPGLDKYEQDDQPDDYRHRMLVNVAALVFLILLVGAGFWLADTMAQHRKDQDCVLSGRRNCSPIPLDILKSRQ
ncbi:MAG: hypothetical protein Q7T81_07385 [Pseudolabrys sp.]|nr:hypothetical protein [Pseudolabrys sp.]